MKLNDELTVGKTGAAGKDGSIGVKGKDGSAVAINGKDGSIGLNGANGANGLTMKSGDAKPAVDGTNVTRLVLEENGKKHDVATLDDGLQFTGNNTGTVNKHKLNTLVKVQGEGVSAADSDNFASASGNINVKANGTDTLELQLAKDLKNLDSVTAAKTVKAGDAVIGGQTVTNAAGDNETGNYVTGLDNKTWNPDKIVSGRAATEDQVKDALAAQTATGLKFDANVGGVQTNKLGSKITIKGEGTGSDNDYSGENLKTFITQDPAGNTTIDVKMNKNLKVETIVATGENGKDGKIGINGKDGVTTNISVTRDGKPGVDGAPGTTTTRIVYEKPDGTKEEVATLNDGMKYGGDTGNVIKKKLNEQVNVVGGITDENKLTTEDNLGVVSDGSNNLKVRLAKVLKGLESVTTGDTVINNNGITISNGAAGNTVSLTKNGLDNGGNKITNVAAGDVSANSTDAVNGSQLHDVKTLAGKHTVVKVDGQENRTDGNLLITKTDNNGQATYNLKLNDELTVGKTGAAGKSGSIGVKGKDGSAVAINGKDGSIGLNGANGANGLTMKSGDAKPAVDGINVTRLVLEENGKKHDVATLDDGMKYGGDTGAVIKKKLNEQVNVVGGITDESKLTTEDNLGVVSDGNNNLKVRLAKALKGLESITAGDTFINNNGITISNGAAGNTVSLTKNGLDNGGNKITNVADGVDGTDAVNVSQLKSQGSDIINKGFGIKAEDGNEVKKKLGETVDVVGDGKNISTRVEGGRVRVGLKDDILLNSVTTGRTRMDTDGLTVQDGSGNTAVTVDKDGLKIKDGPSVTKSGIDAGGKKITNVAAGEADTDAVNVSQLKKAAASATTKVADGKNTTVTSETNADGSKTYHVNLNDDITLGSDPSKQISIKGTEGTIKAGQVTVNGTAGTVNGLTNKTWDPNNITSGQAATEDQLKVVSGQAGKHSSVTAGSNIFVTTGTNANGGTEYKVAVVDTPTFKTITAGNTVMNSSGLTIKNGPSITQTGVDAGGKRITNVAAGDISANSTDAVNGGQLWKTNQTINNIGGAVNELGDRMDRVGAGAAALAALHPLDFDPDDKWDVAAGYGNYKDAHAVAVGAFYRPNEDTMFSVGGSFGGGENMVNAGVSVKLGQGNHVSTSKVAMAKEIVDLRDENKDLKKRLDTMEQKMNSITSGSPSTYNSITGYNNTATNINHVSVIGSENNVTNTNGAVVFGDKRTLTGADGSVVIGSSQAGTSTSVKNAVAIGSEANVTKEGGVALGAGSVASVDKGVAGYDPGTGTNSTDTSSVWKSTQAAVSVGDTSKGITRQITGVAAGTNDTDAVNVAQLRKAKTSIVAAASTEVRAGTNITSVNKTADPGDGHAIYTINAKDTVVTGGTATYASNGAGTATLTNSDGTTATVTGLQDRYTSSASLSGDTLNFTRNDGSTYSVSGIASSQDIKNVTNKVGELGTRVNRVGAGAAALAALHPLDFDPDDKWDFAAGYGNYKDAHAVSVGAFYRPNEDTMFSVGGSFGAGENMVNAGVSVKLGQGNHVSTSKVAMAKEIVDLRDENKDLKKRLDTMEQKMNSILGILDMGKKKDFPDVPENHWAYEYVATLAGNGIIEGYPDGEFKGDRSMTRYEFAAMFYRALKNGAPVDDNMDRAMNEFEPELRQIRLDRIRVDRISGKDNDRNKVERVRVNSEDDKAKNDYRDVYGSHISPKA